MQIEGYIDELLYRYNCVVVPDFGAFLTHRKPARINRISHTLYPPSKSVSFNEQLSTNDGLLISHIAQAEKLSYEEMLERMKGITSGWKSKLKTGERLTIGSVGKIWTNNAGKIQFQPNEKVNFLTSSFGLSAIVHTPATREVLKEEVVALEEKVPFIITQEKREAFNFRPYLKYAAVILLAFSTGLTGFRAYENTLENSTLVHDNAREQVNKQIQEATFFDTKPVQLAPVKVSVAIAEKEATQTSIGHHIIAGAFRVRANADKKVRQLKRKGYNAYYVGSNPYGLHQVAFDGFTDVDEALEFLTRVRRTESRDAWLLSKR
ncbi:MAG: HU-CCDC81 and SPOR domain-containing protein [Eudoraea sp.]|nr:HU-CCDC81 and SPOR domain-containing protein [Eudoraea sp.]